MPSPSQLRRNRAKSKYRRHRGTVYAEADYTCALCGLYNPSATHLSLDHIVPLSEGGDNSRENLRCLCQTCNNNISHKENWPELLTKRREILEKAYAAFILGSFPTVRHVDLSVFIADPRPNVVPLTDAV